MQAGYVGGGGWWDGGMWDGEWVEWKGRTSSASAHRAWAGRRSTYSSKVVVLVAVVVVMVVVIVC